MAFVVADACIRCQYTDCVQVCPTDCFREGATMLVIDPTDCIDCALCAGECPADAILSDTEAGAGPWVVLNATYGALWPVITHRKAPPADADAHRGGAGKYERYFSAEPAADW